MEEDIENALNNLWNSLDDEFFNLTYSQEQMQEDIRLILNRYNYLDSKLQNLINKYKEQEKIINLMAIGLFDYANLGVLIDCPAEYDGIIDLKFCKMNLRDRNCVACIKEYFQKKARE